MSIVKNNSSTSDLTRTIKVLSQVDGYNINKYVHLENCGYHLGYVSNSSFYIMMRCELPSGATGYLFGIKNTSGTSGDFYVKCDATTITWAIGSDTWTKARESGVHEYGFVDGKPVYDNALVSTTAVAHSGIHSYTLCIGGVHKTNNTYEYISAIDLYRFNARYYAVASPTSSSTAWLGAFYPTSVTLRNARKLPEASLTIYHNDGATFSNSASTETVTYGVQLDDLRDITESGYRDLIAICADDKGVAEETGWTDATAETPCVASKTGEDSLNFAIYLGNGSTHVPLPSGWAVTKSGTYELGELIKGRKPKWSIWNDAVKFGKYVDTSTQPTKVRFNVFRLNDGTNTNKIELARFANYDTSKNYPPSFEFGDTLVMEFHNGVAVTLAEGNTITGNGADEGRVFAFSTAAGGLGIVKLGNLPLWNYTKDEILAGSVQLQELAAVGGGLIFELNGDVVMVFFKATSQTYTRNNQTYPMPLCADSDTDTKNMFKYDGFSGQAFFQETMSEYLRLALQNNPTTPRTLKVSMALSLSTSITPSNLNIVDCSNLVRSKNTSLTGAFNNRISSSTLAVYGDRVIVGENGGIVKDTTNTNEIFFNISQAAKNNNNRRISVEITPQITTNRYGYGIGIVLGAAPASGTPIDIFDNSGNPLFVAFLVGTASAVYSSATNTAIKDRFIAFAKLFKNDANAYYGLPFTTTNWREKNLYPLGQTSVDSNRVGAAFFMWQDLMYPGKNRGSGGNADIETGTHTSEADFPQRYMYDNNQAPVTAHIRLFRLSEAPHAWNLYWSNNRGFNETAFSPYITAGSRDFIFHYENNLIPFGSYDCVDAYVSIWNGNTFVNGASDVATVLNGKTITLTYQVPYEPKEQRITQSAASFSISGMSSSVKSKTFTNGNYKLDVDIDQLVPYWVTLKNGTNGQFFGGFVHLRIYNTVDDLKAKTFFINIS